ncbi:MAG TPA: TonB-dependent receptor, partial [Terriglobia bacterium]|nr:TonB-dependent receptor [Terriglobia bacterium]
EPSQADRFEATLGPSSAAYGSDSLGGTLHILSEPPRYGAGGGLTVHGNAAVFANSGDASGTARGEIALSNDWLWWLVGGSARRLNNLRAGHGIDSHNVFRRYFGLEVSHIREMLGARLRETAFAARSAHTKLALRWGGDQSLSGWFHRTDLIGQRSYRDLLGGLGRLRSDLDPQRGQFGYVRYEKARLGFLDTVTGVFSYNLQQDGALRQGSRLTDAIVVEDNSARVLGYILQGASHLGQRHAQLFGGEIYQERVESVRYETNPVSQMRTQTRALFPNGTRYRTAALFLQNMTEVIPGRLRAQGGVRYTSIRFQAVANENLDPAGASLGVADSTQTFHDLTFHTSASYQLQESVILHLLIGRGFRAPNVSDLGRVGLNGGLGYEVSNEDAVRSKALLGTDSGEGALSKGRAMARLRPERLLSYEAGITFQLQGWYARIQAFDAEFSDPIARRTLLFPVGSVPATVGGVAVAALPPTAAQQSQGVVTVAPAGIDSRAIRTAVNDGKSKYYGLETTVRYAPSSRWSVQGSYSWMNGRDLNPNIAARRLPPQNGSLALTYSPSGNRPWLQGTLRFAGAQRKMNPGDLDDERIGASRSRADIANFFNSAIVQPYLLSDSGVLRFAPTGESLDQIRDRVLPLGAVVNGVPVVSNSTRVPLYASTPGWMVLDFTGGWALAERVSLRFGVLNLLDRNYRVHGSGIDSTGRSGFAGFEYTF